MILFLNPRPSGFWVGGEDREGEACECADKAHPANELDECSGAPREFL